MTRIYILFVFSLFSLLSYSFDEGDSSMLLNDNNERILLQETKNRYNDSLSLSIKSALEAIKFSKENNQLDLEARSYLLYGNALRLKLDKFSALRAFFKAIDIAKQISNDSILINANLNIGKVYNSLDKESECFYYSNEALILAKKNNDIKSLPIIYNLISNYYYKKKNYKSALNYLTKSHQGFINIGDSLQALVPFQSKIWIYYRLKDTVSATNTALQAIKLLKRINVNNYKGDKSNTFHVLEVSINIYLGYSMGMQKHFEKALNYTLQGINLAKNFGYLKGQAIGYKNLSEIYSKTGDFKNAFQALNNYKLTNDSLRTIEQRDKIEVIAFVNEALQNEKRINQLENKSKIQVLYIIIGICFSLFIFMLFIFYYNRLKLKNKLHKQERVELDLRINQKSREIVSSALLISEKIKTIKSIKENVDNIVLVKDSPSINDLNEVRRKLRETIRIDNNWEKIKLHFQEINPTFFKKLNKFHPLLSINDMKHCAYIYMNITTNDVAQIMNVSIRTVESARYRIKKKMGLNKESRLHEELFKY